MKASETTDSSTIVEHIAKTYFSHPDSLPSESELNQWRPRGSLWSAVQGMTTLLPRFRSRQSNVDGHQITYWEIGSLKHPTVVLLHGFGASKENWLSLAFQLGRNHHLLIPDLPGFGQSSFLPDKRYTYQRQAERLAQWFAGLRIKQAHWVGSSMGGAIAGVLAATYPGYVASLTLMNAAGLAGGQRSPMEAGLLQGKNVLIPGSYKDVVQLFRLTTHRNQGFWARVMPPLMAKDMMHRGVIKRRLFEDMLKPEVKTAGLLPNIAAPTLVLWGERDQIIDVCCVKVFQSLIPHAQTKVFKNIGHLPMLEAPRLTARTLKQFWKSAHI